MNKITWGHSAVEIASQWEELSRCDLLFLGREYPIRDTPEFHLKAFYHFMKKQKWGGDKRFWRAAAAEDIYDVLTGGGKNYLFAFLFESPCMENALWTRFRHRYRLFFGPAHELSDLTFGEFRYAEDCLQAYLNSKQDAALDAFIAVLWRSGLKKQPFKLQKVDAATRKVKSLPKHLKCALLLQYVAMRGHVIKCNKDAFEAPEAQQNATSGEKATWGMLISALATNITEVESIENMPLWTALEWIANRKKLKPKRHEQPTE